MTDRVRVLVVDDSAFARKVVRQVLQRDPRIEVVGIARDGLEALESIAQLRPDVVTLDLVMPELDGIGVLRALPPGGPRVVVVSITDRASERGLEALEAGAVDLVQKPTALASERLYALGEELVLKVLAAAHVRVQQRTLPALATPPVRARPGRPLHRLVVIGASTGGPQALSRLVPGFPADLHSAVAIALHIPAGYTEALAARLSRTSAVAVREAKDGMALVRGEVVLARGGAHLEVEGGHVRVFEEPVDRSSLYCPSVDRLFASAAREYGRSVLGVVLTGMGEDGLAGARAIREAGGTVLTEAESSCIVYGMPRAVREQGLAADEAPIERMAETIETWL